MSPGLRPSEDGQSRFDAWRENPTTEPTDIPIVREVLSTIAQDGWPPAIPGPHPAPRWPYRQDPYAPVLWIVAPRSDLWVVLELDADTFGFVTVVRPTPDQEAEAGWMVEPPGSS